SLKDAVAKGQLVKLVLGNAYVKWYRPPEYYTANNWRGTLKGDGGAALINQSIHTIDLLLNVMGPVKSVLAKTRTLTHDIEGEDIGVAVLEFENGALGTIEGSTAIYAGFPERLEIHGNEGSVVMEAGKIVACKGKNEINLDIDDNRQYASGSSNPMAIGVSLHINQFKEITDAILDKRQPEVDGEEALKSVRVIEAIYESSRTGKEVLI
ncbi:MAG TPA: Gfo/Idh/MocA family oxidoreductase, partial [Gammaproteobacteria bacterium]